jgi:RHS repeat-associated protein
LVGVTGASSTPVKVTDGVVVVDRAQVTGSAALSVANDSSAVSADTYTYDAAQRLIGLQSPTTTATYPYDGDGLRMSETVDGATSQFAWNQSGSLPLLLADGTNDCVYGPGGMPIEQITGSTVVDLHQDGQGSTRLLTSATGAVVGTYSYDAYGNVTSHTGASTPLEYHGQYTDAATGLQYLQARYYDPATAQFLTVDPDVATTLSPYGYVQENPLNSSDPGGLMNDASSGSGGYYTSGPEKGCEINLSGGPALCPIGGGQVAPMGSAPAGGASLVPNYVSTCLSFVIGELCLTRTDGGHTYVSIGPGLGTPGVSDSSGYVRGGSADQMISGWSVHVGGGTFVGGGYASGGACPLGSGPQGPYGSVETPGSAGIFWTYGFGI